jgi:hypothetical protein
MNGTFASALIAVLAVAAAQSSADAASLVVHEWGTFTSFQDREGLTIPGINVDDEPVPKFVHRLSDIPIFTARSSPALWSQGAPRCHPDVTLRLETPVLYFYPQRDFPLDRSFDVRATFAGGWVTEFFPSAAVESFGFPRALQQSTTGSIHWKALRLSRESAIKLPETTERVWLAPRNVNSAVVINDDKAEAEKYLFYRGVGHIDAPIVVRKEAASLSVSLRDEERFFSALPRMWVAHVTAGGQLTYRTIQADKQRNATSELPTAGNTTSSGLADLRHELKAALVAEGLYADEAEAMLATWQLSYFDSEGLRVFFVLPRAWTDAQLPLWMSMPADITRVMLGRVELISPHQQAVLQSLYELPEAEFNLTPLYYEDQSVLKHVSDGTASHAELYRIVGRQVPEALRLYESLGRFRDALLTHEFRSTSDTARRKRLQLALARFGSCYSESALH